MSRKKLFLWMAIAILVVAIPMAWSQEVRATLGGRVLDSQGAVVPNAKVDVISDDTGVVQHATTNGQGNWVVQFLLPGRYRFTVTAQGFNKVERKGMTLQAGDNKTIDLQLQVGAVTETVEVTAEAPLIDTNSATSGTVITGREILEMPSMSRVSTLLATLAPGVSAQDQNNNPLHPWSYYGASQIDANGGYVNSGNTQMIRTNNYQLDGMPNTKSGGYISYIPSPDSLQEFKVQTNAYDAQVSRATTATINMETKSGSSAYHGGLYEFNQNNVLNALPYGTPADKKPVIHLNSYGGTFGGPVRIPKLYNGKEKTFFFVNFEGLRNSNPTPTFRSVPTELERSGDFSQSFTMLNGVKYPINIYDPSTVVAGGARTQFTNNVVPSARLNPIALNLLKYVPLPNYAADLTQGNNVNDFRSSAARTDKMATISLRFDHQWNDSNRSFAVYRWNTNDELQGNDFANAATGVHQKRTPRSMGLDHVWTIDSSKVLDLRFNVNRYEEWTIDNGASLGFDQASLGLPAGFVSQLKAPSFPSITGFAGNFGSNNNTYTMSTSFTWNAGMTHTYGNHTFKYGGEFWVLQQANGNYALQPQFTFGSDWTRPSASVTNPGTGQGSTFASFLLGLPNGGTVNNNATGFYSQHFTGVYFQDDWRATSKLTLNLGLRWDYERPVVERFNRMVSNYDRYAVSPINAQVQAAYAANNTAANLTAYPILSTLLTAVPVNAIQALGAQLFAGSGVGGTPRTVQSPDYHEFQPRIGFAYQIDPTLVIRGGIGRFTMSTWENASQNGFSQATNLTATKDNYFTPFDTLSNPFQTGILPAAGASLGAMSNLGNGPAFYNQNPGRPHTLNISFGVQKQLKNWLFDVGYVHTKADGIWVSELVNFSTLDQWKQLQTPTFDANGKPVAILPWNQTVPNPFYGIPGVAGTMGTSKTVAMNYLLRPIGVVGGDNLTENDNPIGSTQYDALHVKVEHRFSKGFSVINSFTWSKTFDNTSFWGPQISGYVLEHRLADQDRPFHLSVAPIWDLPFGHNRAFGKNLPKALDFIAGGWSASGNYTIQSGTPVTFGTASFFSGQDFSLQRDQRTLNQWFDTSAFMPFPSSSTCLVVSAQCAASKVVNYASWTGVQNLPGYGYVPVTSSDPKNGVYQDFANYIRRYPTRFGDVRNPRVNEVNIAMVKNFHATERVVVQYRFEVFNAFNYVRFGAPNADPTSSGFGKITPTQQNSPRQVQMGLKINF